MSRKSLSIAVTAALSAILLALNFWPHARSISLDGKRCDGFIVVNSVMVRHFGFPVNFYHRDLTAEPECAIDEGLIVSGLFIDLFVAGALLIGANVIINPKTKLGLA